MKAVPILVVAALAIVAAVFVYQAYEREQRARYLAYARERDQREQRQAGLRALAPVPYEAWVGKAPTNLLSAFPSCDCLREIPENSPAGSCDVTNWRGWASLSLSFASNELVALTLMPGDFVSTEEAALLCAGKLKVTLPPAPTVRTDTEWTFTQLPGKVPAVTLVGDIATAKQRAWLANIEGEEMRRSRDTQRFIVRAIVLQFAPQGP
jgi:hypothetical protein